MKEGALEEFDRQRGRLTSLAYRILGSNTDADDAVQEVWIRLQRSDVASIENLPAWLTTVTARISLNTIRSRTNKREDPFDQVTIDSTASDDSDVGDTIGLADSVSRALVVVLDTLDPPERVAFVLHDLFAVPFVEIAVLLERTPEAARQLASRARRRIRTGDAAFVQRARESRAVTDAFYAAAQDGDLDRLLAILHPDMDLQIHDRSGGLEPSTIIPGSDQVARRALSFARPDAQLLAVFVGERPGVLAIVGDQRISVMAFTVLDGRITAIDALVDPVRLSTLHLS